MLIKSFKAPKQTHRFRKGQRVWLKHYYANCSDIFFKWRGRGRYVRGLISNGAFSYSPDEFSVTKEFYNRVMMVKL